MKKLVILFFIMLLAFPSNTLAAEKLSFATTDWPPYIFIENNKLTGLAVEIVMEICKRLGISADIDMLPWSRVIKYGYEGQVDAIFCPLKTEDRLKTMYFSSEPIGIEKNVLMALQESGIKPTNKISDFGNKDTGIVRGYDFGAEFENSPLEKFRCDDDTQVLKMLDRGRIQLAAGEEGVLKYIRKKNGFRQTETVYTLSATPNYVAFSKKALGERGKVLAEKFGEVLRQLKEEGFIKKIERKYFD